MNQNPIFRKCSQNSVAYNNSPGHWTHGHRPGLTGPACLQAMWPCPVAVEDTAQWNNCGTGGYYYYCSVTEDTTTVAEDTTT